MTLDRDRVAAALEAYDIGGELGRGGWGIVLEGTHRQLGREVAIKELPRAFASDPMVRARFVAEARLLASLDHPHIVPVYDYVEHEGLCLLVMEKLPGGTVWQEVSTHGLVAERACAVILATCGGLHFAHQRGILHRDIKPENLMYSAAGIVKVTDFGIAKVIGGGQSVATVAGDVLGTPAYMAPEQAQGQELSAETDVYAVGTMLYELLSGRLPYQDDGNALSTLHRHVHDDPIPLREVMPAVPDSIAAVVMRAISRERSARPATAEQLALELATGATIAWGPGWLTARGGVAVLAASQVVAITEQAAAPTTPAPQTGATLGSSAAPAPVTDAEAPPVASTPASPTIVPQAAPAPAPLAAPQGPVMPQVAAHAHGAAVDVAESDVVPLKQVLERPRSGAPFLLGALALAVLVVVVAFAGLGSPSHDRAGTGILINGKDPGASTLSLSVDDPIAIGGPSITKAEISVGGTALASSNGKDVNGLIIYDLGAARYLLSGEATLKVSGPGATPHSFAVKSSQTGWLTAPAIASLVLLMLALAAGESLGRPLWKGHRQTRSMVLVALLAAVAAVAASLVTWVLGAPEPSTASLAIAAVLGAGAGVLFSLAAVHIGQRRVLRRAGTRS
ncbi:MAG: hypothetical protein QOC92_4677 [Acidimicrobiaceae bacterium]|jgi:serine/threonine-protein kinase